MKWLDALLSFPFRDAGDIIHFTQDEHGNILVIAALERKKYDDEASGEIETHQDSLCQTLYYQID